MNDVIYDAGKIGDKVTNVLSQSAALALDARLLDAMLSSLTAYFDIIG